MVLLSGTLALSSILFLCAGGTVTCSSVSSPSNQPSTHNNLYLNNIETSRKAREQYDDPSETVEGQASAPTVAIPSKPLNSPTLTGKGETPLTSPDHFHDPTSPIKVETSSQQCNVYQNALELHGSVVEPPPNYDELDLFPAHNYQTPPSSLSSAAISPSEDARGIAMATVDSGTGSAAHEHEEDKQDLQPPPLSPDDHETML